MAGPDRARFRFFAAERSYFSAKVRPALRAKRVAFDELLPTPAAYREIRERTGLAFIPVLVTPEDETWQDTSEILDALEERFPAPALIPSTPVQGLVARLVELFADEVLLLPAMHYRWGTPEGEADARGSFAASSGDVTASGNFADRMSGTLPALGVSPDTAGAIEAHTAELFARLEALFAEQPFVLGRQPSLADCALMGPLYAHLYLDAVPGPLLRRTAPRVAHWIERMNHPDPSSFAGFCPDDTLHPAVTPLLELIGRDAAPILLDTVRDFERWADDRPADLEQPPRGVGLHRTRLGSVAFQRYTSPYTLWMLQRVLDGRSALSDEETSRIDAILSGTGCEALAEYTPRHRLGKRAHRLVFEA